MTNETTPSARRTPPARRPPLDLRSLEQARAGAHAMHKTCLAISLAVITMWITLVGVHVAVHSALSHGLDSATANSLGDGINDTLNRLTPILITVIAVTLAAILTGEMLINTIQKRQATAASDQETGPWDLEHQAQSGEIIRAGKRLYLAVNDEDGNLTLAPVAVSNLRDDWKRHD